MKEAEKTAFENLNPLINLALSENEGNLVARLLNYTDAKDLFKNGFSENPFLRNAFQTLSFLVLCKGDQPTLEDFYSKLIFTDKDVERKVIRTFNLEEYGSVCSVAELELQWLLETDLDELD